MKRKRFAVPSGEAPVFAGPRKAPTTPTSEQQAIIDAAVAGENLVVDARAGSGKTSTLQMMAKHIDKPTLYLAYNRAAADDANGKFPGHVSVMTTHSLAYRSEGAGLRHKLSRPAGDYVNVRGTGREIAMHFGLDPINVNGMRFNSTAVGYAALSTVRNFENSADAEVSARHVSVRELVMRGMNVRNVDLRGWDEVVLAAARKLWAERIDPDNDCLAEHDTYLKLFQLSKPRLQHDLIMLDEAQDTNECVLDIILNQEDHAQIALVGDQYQMIYQFRGSLNAMALLPWRHLELTHSFRFGPELADFARKLVLDDDTMRPIMRLEGHDGVDTKVHDSGMAFEAAAHIYRTNAALLLAALPLIEAGKSVSMSVDARQLQRKLDSVVALHQGDMRAVTHADLRLFESWGEFVQDAELQNPEHKHMAKIVENGMAPRVTHLLRGYRTPRQAEAVFTTAHKSKGLEWDNVVLGNDFQSVAKNEKTGMWHHVSEGERNLLYVAATRAKKNLVINDAARDVLALADRPEQSGLELEVHETLALAPDDPLLDAKIEQFAEDVDARMLDKHGDPADAKLTLDGPDDLLGGVTGE